MKIYKKFSVIFLFRSLSTAGRDVYLSLTERDVTCKLQLWTLFISCKTVYTEKISVNLPENVVIQSGCWTSSGWFVFCDTFMNVYRTQPSVPTPDVCVKYEENNSEPNALICPTKQGFILYTTKTLTVSVIFVGFIVFSTIVHLTTYQCSVLQRFQRCFCKNLDNCHWTHVAEYDCWRK